MNLLFDIFLNSLGAIIDLPKKWPHRFFLSGLWTLAQNFTQPIRFSYFLLVQQFRLFRKKCPRKTVTWCWRGRYNETCHLYDTIDNFHIRLCYVTPQYQFARGNYSHVLYLHSTKSESQQNMVEVLQEGLFWLSDIILPFCSFECIYC